MKLLEPLVSLSLKNILLATDLTSASEAAFQYARALARKHGSHVHAIHVGGEYSYQLLEPEALEITFRELPESELHPTETLKRLFQGLPTQVPLRHGAIWEVIKEVIARREIDLLVLWTHGRTGLDRMLYGSIADDVLRNVECPVLTIGPDVKFTGKQELAIKHVLLATDFDKHSSAPAYAVALANDFHAELTVLNAVHDKPHEQLKAIKTEELTIFTHPDLPSGRPAKLPTEQEFAIALPVSAELWCAPNFVAEYGEPAPTILEVSGRVKADLIVLGARHPEPAKLNSHLLWPTAAKVIAGAACPVLTVRQQE